MPRRIRTTQRDDGTWVTSIEERSAEGKQRVIVESEDSETHKEDVDAAIARLDSGEFSVDC